ncbi:MAG: RcnB family protein [Rhizorhabdus sp.]
MKKFIIAALAASVAASPVLAAPWDNGNDGRSRYEQRHDNGRYEQRHDNRRYDRHDNRRDNHQTRSWKKGQRFDSRYARNYRVISGPSRYHLRPAPRGYRWVQSGNDAVMVGITTGIIAAVMANILN